MGVLALSNNVKRKKFLNEYRKWDHIQHDGVNNFDYYRYTFEDGSFVTAIEYSAISICPKIKGTKVRYYFLTLTKTDQRYVPIRSNDTEILEHVKQVVPNKLGKVKGVNNE